MQPFEDSRIWRLCVNRRRSRVQLMPCGCEQIIWFLVNVRPGNQGCIGFYLAGHHTIE
jgi:hypothetical protein